MALGSPTKFFTHPDGRVVSLPKLPVSALRGLFKRRGRPATIEEMNEAVAAGAVERFRRSESDEPRPRGFGFK